jgi:hypothetical protein
MPEDNGRINEAVRAIRWRMAHEKTSFAEDLRMIPQWLMALVVILFLAAHAIAQFVIAHGQEPWPDLSRVTNAWAMAGVITLLGVIVGTFLLLVGFVNRDAKRRGMRYVLWTFIAFLVPYFIGIISYFLVREPLLYPCPQCGATVSARFNFCPSCKFNLRPTCPQCKHEVRIGDHYCPSCACDLAAKETVASG